MATRFTPDGSLSEPRARDSRTLLPDRDCFYRDVAPIVDKADAENASLALLVVDISGLDLVLRTFGPRERDLVMGEVGRRIKNVVDSGMTPYHITQGRFSVVLPGSGWAQATERAKELGDALRKPFQVSGFSFHLEAYIGISHYPEYADSLTELVRTTVFACDQARRLESQYATFDESLDQQERHRFRLMIDLERVLESETEIELAYQPQIDLDSGACVGVEGLCRWDHADFGMIPPGHFLPFVEQTPSMMALTGETLRIGLRDLAAWQLRGYEGSLAINLSPTLFRQPDMLDRVLERFEHKKGRMDRVHFEITETGIMDRPNRAINVLAALRHRGSKIAIDDFGTGHSSLAYLADLPIDLIKIDMYFVHNMSKPWGRAIVGAAASLADTLGLISVAEGIETPEQLEQCRELGVNIGQGFHLAQPMFRAEFEKWLGLD